MSDPIYREFDHAAFVSKTLGKINDETFWKTVLWLLLLAGLWVIVPALALVFGPFVPDTSPSAPPM